MTSEQLGRVNAVIDRVDEWLSEERWHYGRGEMGHDRRMWWRKKELTTKAGGLIIAKEHLDIFGGSLLDPTQFITPGLPTPNGLPHPHQVMLRWSEIRREISMDKQEPVPYSAIPPGVADYQLFVLSEAVKYIPISN